MHRVTLLLLLLAFTPCLACRDSNAICLTTLDCRGGEICFDRICRASCRDGQSCGPGAVCAYGACVPSGGSCTSDDQCLSVERCAAGSCSLLCRSDGDCPAGLSCRSGLCLGQDAGAIDAAAPDREQPDALATDATRPDTALDRQIAVDRLPDHPLADNGAPVDATPTDSTPAPADATPYDVAWPDATPADATPADGARPDAAIARVSAGLILLYTFDEGAGALVHDRSGVDTTIDLSIADTDRVRWVDGGLVVNADAGALTIVRSDSEPSKLLAACQASNAITVEAWITPLQLWDDGPGRIITFSIDGFCRNFSLLQGLGESWSLRLRTSATEANGKPGIQTCAGTTALRRSHVVFTHSSATGRVRGYLDGAEVLLTDEDAAAPGMGYSRGGDYSTWDSSFRLALGWEHDTTAADIRAWSGVYHLVAVYCRALEAAEVMQNYQAGARW
ncbi:MAG: hypothetical protein JXR83_15845 [Deltaproteobacteria bacterium]|nr:hypothetical protein [Deltaproteobacteria bacterium]